MPETLFNRDFSAGWCPSDDNVNGRPNGLLQMDNLELDRNGALELIHGTQILYGNFATAPAHTMFSKFINGVRCDYSATTDGSVYRNNAQILANGNSTNAAFGTAFDFTLICSSPKAIKDNRATYDNLGVSPPTVAPTVTQNIVNAPYAEIGNLGTAFLYVVIGGLTVITPSAGNQYDQCTTDANGNFIMQSINTPVSDCTNMNGVGGTGVSTDDDFVIINGYTANPVGVSLEFDVLLEPGNSVGAPVNDMYTYVVQDLSQQATFDTITGVFTISIPRSSFSRAGANTVDWSTVYGYRLTIKVNQPAVTVINIWGEYMGISILRIRGGTSAQFGTYRYSQVNVNNTGSYIAKSVLGPASNPITLNGVNAQVSVQDPTTVDTQCNEAWIFRTGGNLGGNWYRVAVVTYPFTAIYDNMGDQALLDLNITQDINLISVTSIPGTIYDIIGPIEGRWFYFSSNFMYPSDINDPDLVNPSIAIRICGSINELFMWARPVSASVCLVGTSIDCYLLTGTFSTFPDGTIDAYYQPLGVKFPPITYDAVSFGGSVYYLAADGWRSVQPTSFGTTYSAQNNQSLVVPNTDRLYRGENCYGYQPPQMPASPGASRMPVTIAKNKLWCFITGTGGRGEVYDFARSYWRPFNYQLGEVSACACTQDNRVIVFNKQDLKIREYDYIGTKYVDGTQVQVANMLFPYKDNGKPRQRKDTYTFKTRCFTQSTQLFLTVVDEKSASTNINPAIVSNSAGLEVYLDLSQALGTSLPKSYQIILRGSVGDLILEDWSIDYDPRPVPLTFLRLYPSNLGSPTKKRLRTWPLVIDTLGQNVIFTPSMDGQNLSPTVFNTNYKQTVFYYVTTDLFGIDYGGTLYDQSGLMEVWDTGTGQLGQGLQPDIVENLPMGHEFDQVGPIEIFRYGKILRMALRCYSAGTPIPFNVFLGDVSIYKGAFETTPGVEDEYVEDLPKGVSGRILRVELGPCPFVFNRYFMKFQVGISGSQNDTELKWLTVPGLSSTMAGGI